MGERIIVLIIVLLMVATAFTAGLAFSAQDAHRTGYERGREDMATSLQEAMNMDAETFLECYRQSYTGRKEATDE